MENFEETIGKAKQTKSDFVISENFKAITFFNTTWKECYQRNSHLKTFFTNIYLQNLTDFTGYFIKKNQDRWQTHPWRIFTRTNCVWRRGFTSFNIQ